MITEEDIKLGIMKENFPADKLAEQLENNVLKSRNDTENIQDLINERNKQNKRIEELVLEIDRLQNIINELEKSIKEEYDYCDKRIDPAYGVGMGVATRVLDKLKELKEGNKDG